MSLAKISFRCALLGLLGLVAPSVGRAENKPAAGTAAKPVEFTRDIRPIFSDTCFTCHGPDEKKRKAKFRIDTKAGAFAELRDGDRAIAPGKVAESVLLERLNSTDPTKRMPPPKSGKTVKPEQIALIQSWIEQGARWSDHWAFVPPTRPVVPNVVNAEGVRNPIDQFIRARLEREQLAAASEASRTALLRRVTLDLTGLPPTPAEIDVFLGDKSSDAYEKVVDRLLRSPRYGEHMARHWLDIARYGDTHGLHLDNYREIWPYRDWVIKAFNSNMPYDRFVIEQLAGDLLPNATQDQLIATGYNRCHITTAEGGSIDEEVYVRNVADQIDTNGNVFLGMSVGCARCHDHKFDPMTMKDYYQLFAFFNSIDGPAQDGNAAAPPPVIRVGTPETQTKLAALQARTATVRKLIDAEVAKFRGDSAIHAPAVAKTARRDFVWIDDALPAGAKPQVGGANLAWDFVVKPAPVHRGEKSLKLNAKGLMQVVVEQAQPPLLVGKGDTLFAHVYLDPARPPKEIMLQWHTTGWLHRAYWGENRIDWGKDKSPERLAMGPLPKAGQWVRLQVEAAQVGINPGQAITGWAFTQFDGSGYWDAAGILTETPQGPQPFDSLAGWEQSHQGASAGNLPKPIQDALKLPPEKRSDGQKNELRDYFIENAWTKAREVFEPLHKQLAAIQKERDAVEKQMPTTMVFKERSELRPSYILHRGEYDQRRQQVERNTPAFLPPLPSGAPRNRLGFAQWLVAPGHPLTARVAVNRYWQQVFGFGLVRTAEDFGSQGEPPSHPELLDWLAVEFRDNGWNVKQLMKLYVMSATYRQSSRVTPDALAKDPGNRLLARGPRYRLDAETLRDQALFLSGLLVEKVGGPSVKPPQPAGLWEAVGYTGSNTARFTPDSGHEKVHRRSMYTFWKRTAAPPQMTTLDAPSRESCTMRRERTNTPLQALLLMNETQYVECSRVLAEVVMKQGGANPEERIAFLFRRCTSRFPEGREMAEILSIYRDMLAHYTRATGAAKTYIAVGETKPDSTLPPNELAAWTMVANLVLNLDEVVNK